jgi:parvulin-like peptidyl-prolyl isomerase
MRPVLRLSLGLMALTLASCSAVPGLGPSPTPVPPTATPVPPTQTPLPPAAAVNGEAISLSDYQAEVARFEAAQTARGTDLATLGDYKAQVLDSMVDLRLLAQGAQQAGVQVSEADVQSKIDQLASDLGGNEAIGAWLAADMVNKLTAEVPNSVDQVHARHILVATRDQADQLRQQIADGADFSTLAVENSLDLSTRPAGGDLGWFPEGYLTAPEIEQAAFSMQPGDVSQVIETKLGFDIVEVLDRGVHPLSPDAKRHLEAAAVQAWLTSQRQAAKIDILVNP